MDSAQVLGYPLLLIAALEILLGRLLLTQHPRTSSVNKATAACVFAAALWSLSSSLMYIRLSLGLDYMLFARTSWIGWFTVPAAIQSVLYLREERSRKAFLTGLVLYPFWTIVLGLCIFTDLVVTDGYIPLPYRNSPGPIEMPLRFIGSMQVLWLIVEIVRLRKQVTGFRRSQLGYYLSGTIFFGTGGAVIGGLLQLFTGTGLEPSLSAYFGFPWALLIFYAITRYRLFDIRIVLSRALGILALSVITAGFQFLVFMALEPMLGAMATIFLTMPLIGIIFFGTPASRAVLQWINELVLGERLAAQNLLKETANASISILYLDELLHFIVDRVRTGLKIERACLFLRERDGRYLTRECFLSIGAPGEPLVLSHRVVDRLANDPRMIIRDELANAQDAEDQALANDLAVIGAEMVLPLVSKRQLLGVLALGERAGGEPYLHSDIDVLETLAGHAAIAIENARLFDEAGLMRATIKEQEGIFRTLANTLPATIFIHRGGKFLYFNATGTRMTGYTSEEILNMDFWGVVHPDYRELIMARGRSRLSGTEPPPQYEFKIVRKDGEERWVLMSAGTIVYEGKTAVIGTIFDITDRKKAEEDRERYYQERLAEQERFSAVLSTTNEGFWIVNDQDRIMFVNDAYCRISGYTRDELLSMSIADLEVDESPAAVREHSDRVRAAGYDRFETKHRRKDGSVVDLEVSVNRYRDERTVFAFLRDITDRKRLETERSRLYEENVRYYRERIAEQARFAAVVSATNEGFYICGNDSAFLFVNDAYCRMLGYGREQLLAMSVKDVEVDEDPDAVDAHTAKVAQEGHDLFETRHRRKDGTVVDLEINVNRFKDDESFFSFCRDITDRKRAEEALRRSEERFRQVSETAREWIWEVDTEGRYTYSSPVVSTILGYLPEEIVGKRYFFDFFVPEEQDQLKREASRIMAEKGTFRDFTNRNLHKDGREVFLSTSGTPILDSAGNVTGYRGVDVDITERIRAEQERSRLYEESVTHYQALLDEQHRHQEEKEKILKDLHDGIGGLTTNINLLAELARKDDDLGSVKRSLGTIAELSRDSLSEIRGFIQSLDARELSWQAMAAEFRHLGNTIIASHGIRFSLSVDVPDNGVVPSSTMAMSLFRIYKEALANIVKHAKATDVKVSFAVGDDGVTLDVQDNGIGVQGSRSGGRGLLNMRSRAQELGGTLTMTGGPGTQIVAKIPIP